MTIGKVDLPIFIHRPTWPEKAAVETFKTLLPGRFWEENSFFTLWEANIFVF
jgi:hypothetical protein